MFTVIIIYDVLQDQPTGVKREGRITQRQESFNLSAVEDIDRRQAQELLLRRHCSHTHTQTHTYTHARSSCPRASPRHLRSVSCKPKVKTYWTDTLSASDRPGWEKQPDTTEPMTVVWWCVWMNS